MAQAAHSEPVALDMAFVVEEVRTLDLDAVWAEIQAVEAPGPEPAPPPEQPSTLFQRYAPWFVQAYRTRFVMLLVFACALIAAVIADNRTIIVTVIVLALIIGLLSLIPRNYSEIRPNTDLEKARSIWELRLQQFKSKVTDAEFHKRKKALLTLRKKLHALQSLPLAEHGDWRRLRKAAQTRQFLQKIPLAKASNLDLNERDLELLRSNGIVSAADCNANRLNIMPFSAPGIAQRIVDWRKQAAKGFQYDPEAALAPAAAMYFEKTFRRWQLDTRANYLGAPMELNRIRERIEEYREQSYRRLSELWDALQIVERRHSRPAHRPRARS